MDVAPHVGAWIEIGTLPNDCKRTPMSHPTWVRGLKSEPLNLGGVLRSVAPHVGAWIEIICLTARPDGLYVAPHVGAWIEIHLA